MNFYQKIRNKQGGAVILISMVAVIVAIAVILPGIIQTSQSHLASKKIKIHLNSAAKSGAIELVDWNQTTQSYQVMESDAYTAMNNTMNSIFNKNGDNNFVEMNSFSNAEYSTKAYKNAAGTMAYQIFVFNSGAPGLRPSPLEVSSVIYTDSENKLIQGWEDIIVLGQSEINHPTTAVVMRYEMIEAGSREIKSIIRISTSQNKNM